MTDTDLLLYPMGEATDNPSCEVCGAEMPLAKFEALPGSLEFSTFRCPACCHSETFLAEPDLEISRFA
jgi:hypothetical protein